MVYERDKNVSQNGKNKGRRMVFTCTNIPTVGHTEILESLGSLIEKSPLQTFVNCWKLVTYDIMNKNLR